MEVRTIAEAASSHCPQTWPEPSWIWYFWFRLRPRPDVGLNQKHIGFSWMREPPGHINLCVLYNYWDALVWLTLSHISIHDWMDAHLFAMDQLVFIQAYLKPASEPELLPWYLCTGKRCVVCCIASCSHTLTCFLYVLFIRVTRMVFTRMGSSQEVRPCAAGQHLSVQESCLTVTAVPTHACTDAVRWKPKGLCGVTVFSR